VSRLVSTPGLVLTIPEASRKSRRGTQECVRHIAAWQFFTASQLREQAC
jgi:hypothetical protein